MLLAEIYHQQYLPNNLRIRSECTKQHYQITLRMLAQFFGREPRLSDLTDDNIRRFARWMMDSRPRSPATVNQKLGYIAALWRWCAKRGLVSVWPTFRPLPEHHVVPRAWTERQLQALLKSCLAQSGKIGGIPAATWWINLHWFLYETGERIGATRKMTWSMVDVHSRVIDLPAEIRKGKWRGMVYRVSEELAAALQAQRRSCQELVFPFPHCEQTFYNRYKRILIRAGLPTDRRNKLHKMRRSFASYLTAAGGDATRALRHSSARVTEESYLDPSIAEVQPSYQVLQPFAQLKPEGGG